MSEAIVTSEAIVVMASDHGPDAIFGRVVDTEGAPCANVDVAERELRLQPDLDVGEAFGCIGAECRTGRHRAVDAARRGGVISGGGLHAVSAFSLTPVRFTAEGLNVNSPSFAPDGKTVFFLSAKSGSMQLWSQAVGSQTAVQISDLPLDIGSYKLSPDGRQLLLRWSSPHVPAQLAVQSVDGGEARKLTDTRTAASKARAMSACARRASAMARPILTNSWVTPR